MTNKLMTKKQIRQAIIDLVHSALPETGESGNETETQILAILMDKKYAAIDFACSVLQSSFELNLNDELLQNQLEISRIISKVEQDGMDEARVKDVAEQINRLLILSEEYRTQHQGQYTEAEEKTPSFQHLSHTIYVAQGQLEAESIRLFLQSFGIPARVAQESAGVALGLTVGSLGEADVRVAPSDAQDAAQLLQAMKDGLFIFPEDMDSLEQDGEETGEN